MRKLLIIIAVIVIASISMLVVRDKATAPDTDQPQIPVTVEPEPKSQEFDKTQFSTEPSASIWAIVNKRRPLPANYTPQELVTVGSQKVSAEAAGPLQQLLTDAIAANVPMTVLSGYRSYATQQTTYQSYVAKDGVAGADTYSARPGHSEHQTGLAADLGNGTCDLEICFAETPAGKWLAANAAKYGFIIRYPKDQTQVTGYQYEPWHIRYVGKDLASEVSAKAETLETFFGLPPTPSY